MDWIQFGTFLIANMVFTLTLWFWNRAESRADNRNLQAIMEGHRTETNEILKGIQLEMKDFHGRLERQDAEFKAHILYCHDEERNKNK